MFYTDGKLQFEVRVDRPSPLFAKMLQQAIGGAEGEMRVCLQYMFQAWAVPSKLGKYRDLLLHTAAEEIGHIEMLATAVALNLEGAPISLQEEAARSNSVVESVLGGNGRRDSLQAMLGAMQPRQFLSAGLHAMPVDANGVPFTGGYVVASGNLAGDMYANVMAEATGRTLATRLFQMTDDPGMRHMLSYMIARDTMHQNQWLAVLEELGDHLPVPASFPQTEENEKYAYAFMTTGVNGMPVPEGRWSSGPSMDGKGSFSVTEQPGPGEPNLAAPNPSTFDDVH
ncbi:MAG: manganese catalase family protein [Chloroflexi bacterium]|nr:manganese catalase family protein [Chloroflexota bacterium]